VVAVTAQGTADQPGDTVVVLDKQQPGGRDSRRDRGFDGPMMTDRRLAHQLSPPRACTPGRAVGLLSAARHGEAPAVLRRAARVVGEGSLIGLLHLWPADPGLVDDTACDQLAEQLLRMFG
jgi:hypothetical protein